MTHELVYTSAPRGLRPGSIGYCTVAQTDGIPQALVERLELLSAYRHLRVGADPDANGNPVVHAHAVASAGGRTYHVLSRIADSGLDYSGRNNYLAHHVALTADELPRGGPAAVCETWPFETAWDGVVGSLPANRAAPGGSADVQKCVRWEDATGDAGWAGVLAGATAGEPAYLIFRPDQDVLGLIAEAMTLIPPEERWRVTFSTYFTKSGGAECQWRCVPAGSAEAKAAISARRGVVLRLDRDTPGDEPPNGGLVDAARTGVLPPRRARPERVADTPAPRPMRVPAFDTPPDDFDDAEAEEMDASAEALPVAPRARPAPRPLPAAAPSHGLGQLLLGLAMGLLLAAVVLALIEVGTQSSPLRLAGVKGKAEKELDDRRAKLEGDLAAEQANKRAAHADLKTEKAKTENLNNAVVDLRGKLQRADTDNQTISDKFSEYKSKNPEVPPEAKPKYTKKQYDDAIKAAHDRGVKEGLAQKTSKDPPVTPPMPPKVEHVVEKSNGQAGEFLKGDAGRPLYTTKLKGEPKLDVFGLTNLSDTLKVEKTGETLTIREGNGKGDKFEAELKVVNGVVTVTGNNLERFPLLGLAVVRLKGDGGSEFFHLTTGDLKAGGSLPSPSGNEKEYRFDKKLFESLKTGPLVQEFRRRLDKNELKIGPKAKVSINGKEYALEADPKDKDKSEPVCLPNAGDAEPSKIVLKLEANGTLSLHAEYAKAEARPNLTCQIVSADLVREVKDKEVTVRQDILRVRTPEPEKK